jgi:hypothetical protein
MRNVKFDENLSDYKPNSTFVPSSAYEPSSTSVPSSLPNFYDPIMVSSLDDDNEDENPHLSIHLPSVGSIEHEPIHHYFIDGSIQHEKQLVILLVILQTNVIHVYNYNKPPLFWIKLQRLMIHKHL